MTTYTTDYVYKPTPGWRDTTNEDLIDDLRVVRNRLGVMVQRTETNRARRQQGKPPFKPGLVRGSVRP